MRYFTRFVRNERHDGADYTHESRTLEAAIADIAAETRYETFDEVLVLVEAPDSASIITAGAARCEELKAAEKRRNADQQVSKAICERMFYEDLKRGR